MHELRVTCHREVNERDWDVRVSELGGSYFHCHAHATYSATYPGSSPLFLEVFEGLNRVGIATATLQSPRAAILSRLCREVSFAALPATPTADVTSERAVLAAIERELRKLGVFRFHVQSRSSPHADDVLTALGYSLSPRYEFYLTLSPNVDDNWNVQRQERRKKVRKALNAGLQVVDASNRSDVSTLLGLNCDALLRRGMSTLTDEHRIESITRHLLKTSRAKLLICYRDAVPVGALLFGVFGDSACTLISGTSLDGNRYGARMLLHWKMLEALTSRQVRLVNLGAVALSPGEAPESNGLFTFKRDSGALAVSQSSGIRALPSAGRFLIDFRNWCQIRRIPRKMK